jgi:hypothetical protein
MKDKVDASRFNNSTKDAKVQMKYVPSNETIEKIEIKCTLDEIVTKERLPVYEDQSDEAFLKLNKEFLNLIDTYELWENGNANVFVYANFRRCLQGTARDTWDECLAEVEDDRGQDHFEMALMLLTEKILGTDALENQKEYLKVTSKPHQMSVKAWISRIKSINSYMLMMEEGARNFTERELISDVISKNIPAPWRLPFKLQVLHKADRIEEIMIKLQVIETEIKTHQETPSEGNGSRNNNNNNRSNSNGEKNLCKLPGHKGHAWEDCFNNKNGKKFKLQSTPGQWTQWDHEHWEKVLHWWRRKPQSKGNYTEPPTTPKLPFMGRKHMWVHSRRDQNWN